MITTIDSLVTKYNLLKVQFALIIDVHFNVLWKSEQLHRLSLLNEQNKVNFLISKEEMWQYYLMQLQHKKKGNLMLPIVQCCKESYYHIYGVYDDDHQVFVLTLTLISESHTENHEQPPLLNYFQQGIILTTINHSIVHFNQNAVKMIPKQFLQCGLNIEQLFSQHIIKLPNSGQLFTALTNKAPFNSECSILGKGYELNCYFNEQDQQYVFILDDRTELAQLKQQLTEQEYLSEIGKMASTLVHEMRNPMTCIKGYIDLMLMEQKPNAQYMTIIERELAHLTQLCSDILFLSKPIDKDAKGVDLLQIVEEVIELTQLEVQAKHIALNFYFENESTFIVTGNEMYFKQVILNIIKNAVQAINDGGMIDIVLIEKIHSVEFSVKDTGCGIPKEQLSKIFEMFFTTKEYGTGLGLPVVKKVIDQLSGSIDVKSTENVGTKFTIQFPTLH